MQALRRRVAGRDVLVVGVGHSRSARTPERIRVSRWVDTTRSAARLYDASDVVAADVHAAARRPAHAAADRLRRHARGHRADAGGGVAVRRRPRSSFAALAGFDRRDDRRRQRPAARRCAERVGPAAEFVAGLHGLEIIGPECGLSSLRARRGRAGDRAGSRREAARELAWCPGVLLENKTYALTCHVRLAPPGMAERALEEFEALAEPQLEARVLKLLTGVQGARAAARRSTGTRAAPPNGSAPASLPASTRPCRSSISATTAPTKTPSPRSATTTS